MPSTFFAARRSHTDGISELPPAGSAGRNRSLSLFFLLLLLAGCDRQTPESDAHGNGEQSTRLEDRLVTRRSSAADTGKRNGYAAFQTLFSDVARITIPSVVSISMEKTVNASQNPFDFFFDRPFETPPGRQQPRRRRESGIGSGFVTSKDGYILTNFHVVEGAQKITVQFSDGRELEAEVVGVDQPSDLAVIKIKGAPPDDLVPLPFGDSDALQIGEWVVAVGAPFGLYETVTTGIISAKGRQNTGISTYGNFLQTDAAINPGNSGGPLVDLQGRVVGINTAIFSQSGGYMGIGFAIPVNLARNIMESLIKTGKVTRGWLGVSIQPISREMAEVLELPERRGALVGDVLSGGPAAKAGLRRGDVILKIEGEEIKDPNDLMNRIALIAPGSGIVLSVFRGGKEVELKAKVAKREEERTAQPVSEPEENGVTMLGLDVADLTPEVRRQLRIGRDIRSGAVVIRVDPSGAAAAADIQEGDVILEVNRRKVDSSQELRDAVAGVGRENDLLFLLNRRGNTFFALVPRN